MSHDNPLIFLIDTLFDIYIAIVLLRFLLQQVGADFFNPISQFIVKATQKPVVIARRIIPSFRGIDLASLSLAVLLIFIKLIILLALGGIQPSISALLIQSLYDLIQLTFDIFIFAIFVQAILSWVNPDPYNPVSALLNSLTRPILQPIKKRLPLIGGLDLSTIVALIGLMFIKRVVLYIFTLF
ncbi:MAG: YggT family protein [Gammaproteobacteria bacterium]|nr:YggT family protein [Gammaproteobacteria bacterium]MCK5262623.1 YggT family protein [Gammaproteobacteria bacterium]